MVTDANAQPQTGLEERARAIFDGVHDARELIGIAMGAASVCWENPAGAGVFDSSRAAAIADAAFLRLQMLLADSYAGVAVDGSTP